MDGVFVKGLFLCLLVTFSNFSQSSNQPFGSAYRFLHNAHSQGTAGGGIDLPGVEFPENFLRNKSNSGFPQITERVTGEVLYLPSEVSGDFRRWYYQYKKNRLLSITREQLNGNTWVKLYRYLYTYDTSGNQLTDIYQKWQGGGWNNLYLTEYSYLSNPNRIKEQVIKEWRDTSWVNSMRFSFIYDSNGLELIMYYDLGGINTWSSFYIRTSEYDSTGVLQRRLSRVWSQLGWQNNANYIYAYDSLGAWHSELQQGWQTNQWVNSTLKTTTLYPEENKRTVQDQRWLNGTWQNTNLITHSYSQEGWLQSSVTQVWDGDNWKNKARNEFENDSSGNVLNVANQTWAENDWVLEIGAISFSFKGDKYAFYNDHEDQVIVSYNGIPVDAGEDGIDEYSFELLQNYPNPFNPITTIRYTLPEAAHLKLTVYGMMGDEQVILVDEEKAPGRHEVVLNAENKPSGVYFYKIEYSGKVKVGKMLLLK